MAGKTERPDHEAEQGAGPWSRWRKALVTIAAVLTIGAGSYLVIYALNEQPKPSEIAIPTILFIGLGGLALLVVPWKELDYVPTEIAGVKFSQVVNEQKKEQIDAIVPIQEELKELSAKYDELLKTLRLGDPAKLKELIDSSSPAIAPTASPSQPIPPDPAAKRAVDLMELVLGFLEKNRGYFFSPYRIQRWGGTQPGFERLAQYSTEEIRGTVFKAVAEHGATTKINWKGNTLYGFSRKATRWVKR